MTRSWLRWWFTFKGRDPTPPQEALTATETFAKVRALLAHQFDCKSEDVTPATSFKDDLDADSLQIIELTMALEEAFGLEIADEDAEQLQTVGQVVTHVEQRIRGKA